MSAEKILALLHRELGRDIYDIFFMSGKKWIPDARILAAKKVGDPAKAVLGRITAWGPAKLSGMARALEPFLFEPEQSGLVAQARVLLPPALQYLEHA
jgi:hypothetical protein